MFFMRTPMQRKYAIAWRIGGAASREDEISLLDCTRMRKGNMQLKLPGANEICQKVDLQIEHFFAFGA
ncbi:MAG: hypothetical protein HFH74_14330 [Lachnospiraceae bacterium]|nr:hypothetical protein [Lachnospiraceae bacterium]